MNAYHTPHPRLRQICLLAPRLEPVVSDLCRILGLEVCYRDPHLAAWGVENAMLAVGPAFIEVCSPLHAESAAQRFIRRNPDGGGYMAIFNTEDFDRHRDWLRSRSIRIVTELEHDGFRTIQLHPADVGACMIEINSTAGGEDWYGPYYPAGPDWQRHIRRTRVTAFAAIDIKSNEPARSASRWSEILRTGIDEPARQPLSIKMDGGDIRFVAAQAGERDSLSAISLHASSDAAIADAMMEAEKTGHRNGAHSFKIAGVDIALLAPSDQWPAMHRERT